MNALSYFLWILRPSANSHTVTGAVGLFSLSIPCWVASAPVDNAMAEQTILGYSLTSVLPGLAIVIVTILVCFWLLRFSGAIPHAQHDVIRTISTASLGPRERVVLVEVGDTQILIGVTSAQMNALHVLDSPVSTIEKPVPHGNSLSQHLRALLLKKMES
jgi:flagellar protein FliO/FliZ